MDQAEAVCPAVFLFPSQGFFGSWLFGCVFFVLRKGLGVGETIWKFPLRGAGGSGYWAEMPKDALPLSAGWSDGELVVWAMCDGKALQERQFFHVAGTGHELPGAGAFRFGARFLSRVEISAPSGLLIFHVFATGLWDTGAVEGWG